MDYRSPGARSHTSDRTDGSDGATAANYNHTPRNGQVYSPFTTFGHQSPAYISPYHSSSPQPDWDSTQVIPRPCHTLIIRLNAPDAPAAKDAKHKPVTACTTYFKETYSGSIDEDWDAHLTHLENEVFDPENFVPKQ